jgi:hypothetical protein
MRFDCCKEECGRQFRLVGQEPRLSQRKDVTYILLQEKGQFSHDVTQKKMQKMRNKKGP